MAFFLDKINSAPLADENFTFGFNSWVSNLVDSLNEIIDDIQNAIVSRETLTVTTKTADVNAQYIISAAGLTTITLPETCAEGDIVEIVGQGAGGWVLEPASGQTIKVVGSSAGTSIASTNRYDCISIVCVAADTTWVTRNSQTAGFTIT